LFQVVTSTAFVPPSKNAWTFRRGKTSLDQCSGWSKPTSDPFLARSMWLGPPSSCLYAATVSPRLTPAMDVGVIAGDDAAVTDIAAASAATAAPASAMDLVISILLSSRRPRLGEAAIEALSSRYPVWRRNGEPSQGSSDQEKRVQLSRGERPPGRVPR
jgi:hypothetical protein